MLVTKVPDLCQGRCELRATMHGMLKGRCLATAAHSRKHLITRTHCSNTASFVAVNVVGGCSLPVGIAIHGFYFYSYFSYTLLCWRGQLYTLSSGFLCRRVQDHMGFHVRWLLASMSAASLPWITTQILSNTYKPGIPNAKKHLFKNSHHSQVEPVRVRTNYRIRRQHYSS